MYKLFKITLILLLLALSAGGVCYWLYSSRHFDGVYNYQPAKDKKFILKMFEDFKDLLIQNPHFSIEYFLNNLAPTQNPQDKGKSKIKMYYLNGKPIGFISYYPKTFYKGRIHFIAFDKKYHGHPKNYSTKLMENVLKEFKNENLKIAYLDTLNTNQKAKDFYEKLGFKISEKTGETLRYEKKL